LIGVTTLSGDKFLNAIRGAYAAFVCERLYVSCANLSNNILRRRQYFSAMTCCDSKAEIIMLDLG